MLPVIFSIFMFLIKQIKTTYTLFIANFICDIFCYMQGTFSRKKRVLCFTAKLVNLIVFIFTSGAVYHFRFTFRLHFLKVLQVSGQNYIKTKVNICFGTLWVINLRFSFKMAEKTPENKLKDCSRCAKRDAIIVLDQGVQTDFSFLKKVRQIYSKP